MHAVTLLALKDAGENLHGQDYLDMAEARNEIGKLFSPQFVQAILGSIETLQLDAYALGVRRATIPDPLTGTAVGEFREDIQALAEAAGIGLARPDEGIVIMDRLPATQAEREHASPAHKTNRAAAVAAKRGRPFASAEAEGKAMEAPEVRAARLREKKIKYRMKTHGMTRKQADRAIDDSSDWPNY